MHLPSSILAQVEGHRLRKAVEGLVCGSYHTMVTYQTDTEIRGFVRNGAGKEYGVILGDGHCFCSCPDAMRRRGLCKHAVILAFSVLRSAAVAPEGAQQPPNLKLAKVRQENGRIAGGGIARSVVTVPDDEVLC